jgi:asparagine synthase (glutamine-hydrolysing)
VLSPDRSEALAAVERALPALRHRGPDDDGVAVVPLGARWLAVGHARLSIQDLSADGRQPMFRGALPPGARATRVPGDAERGDDGLGLVYNGELYNVASLREELAAAPTPQRFLSHSDTEVLLHGLAREGLDYLPRLRGMFAFAAWDPARARVQLVRDRLGIKPLYWAQPGRALVFGSEVRAVLATGLVPRRVSPVGLERYLAYGAAQDPDTLVEGLFALEPGHSMTVEDGRLTPPRRWWSLPTAVDRTITEEDAVGETRRLLREAVETHLISEVPVGAFLSGGLDSSIIVALMARAVPGRVRAVNVVSDDGSGDSRSELPYAELVAKHCGAELAVAHISKAEAPGITEDAIRSMDLPSVDGTNTWFVSRHTRAVGCPVGLSGLGSDEIFNGYGHFQSLPRLRRLASFPGLDQLGRLASRVMPRDQLLPTKLAQMLASGGDLAALACLQRMLFFAPLRSSLLRPGVRAPADATIDPALSPEEAPSDPLNFLSAFELRGYVQNMLLRDSDSMSMAHGLELRVPFLDHRLVEFALSLPGQFRSRPGELKSLLSRAMKPLLPPAIPGRRKMGFNLAVPEWMRTTLRPRVEAVLLRDNPVLDPEPVERLWQAWLSGRQPHLWSRLWALYKLSLWLDTNVFQNEPRAGLRAAA